MDIPGNLANLSGQLANIPDNILSTLSMQKSKNEQEKDTERWEEEKPEKCYKLRFPQPLKPAEPDQLILGLQLNALKYLALAALACYICGRLHFGYFFGLLAILGGKLQQSLLEESTNWHWSDVYRWIGILHTRHRDTEGIGLAAGEIRRIKNSTSYRFAYISRSCLKVSKFCSYTKVVERTSNGSTNFCSRFGEALILVCLLPWKIF